MENQENEAYQEIKKSNKIRMFTAIVQMRLNKMKPLSFTVVVVDQDNLSRLQLMAECQHQVKDLLVNSKARPDLAQYANDATYIVTSLLEIRHDMIITTKKD